jgi:hypothetical protein
VFSSDYLNDIARANDFAEFTGAEQPRERSSMVRHGTVFNHDDAVDAGARNVHQAAHEQPERFAAST